MPAQDIPFFFFKSHFHAKHLGFRNFDGIGVILGAKFGKRIPQKVFSRAAFVLFMVFGVASVGESIDLLMPGKAVLPTAVISVIYLILVFAGRRKTVKV